MKTIIFQYGASNVISIKCMSDEDGFHCLYGYIKMLLLFTVHLKQMNRRVINYRSGITFK